VIYLRAGGRDYVVNGFEPQGILLSLPVLKHMPQTYALDSKATFTGMAQSRFNPYDTAENQALITLWQNYGKKTSNYYLNLETSLSFNL